MRIRPFAFPAGSVTGQVCVLLVLLLASSAQAQRYEKVWEDEFDTLDRKTWKHWIGTAYNNELQYYTARDTNSYVRDGLLYLWAQSENFGGRQYTSARIESQAQGGHRYGRFEARAKMPTGFGIWPAIWMMPTHSAYGGWPRSGEIDIMEWRGDLPATTYGTAHYQQNGAHRYSGTTWQLPRGTFSDDFHIFAIEWDEVGIRWFVDDHPLYEIRRATLGADPYPFDQPFYWILNVAVGGDFLPNPPPGAKFRQAMVVDYVRVFQDVNQKPTLRLNALPDTVQAGQPLHIAATATDADGRVDSVVVFVDGARMAAATGGTLAYDHPLAVDGCYDIEVRAYDNDGGESIVTARVVVGWGCTSRAFGAGPTVLPDTIHFAHFDYGGQGLGYFDSTPDVNTGNALGNTFRTTEGVDLRPHPERPGAHLVTDITGGEWLAYTLDIPEAGLYDLHARVSVPGVPSRIRLQLGSQTLVRSLAFDAASPQQPFVTQTVKGLSLPAGRHVLRVTALFEGFELDYLVFTRTGSTAAAPPELPAATELFAPTPNPVHATATARFRLESPAEVSLQIVDVLGHVVATLAEDFFDTGLHTVAFERGSLASGLYLLRMWTPQGQHARPFVVIG